MNLAFSLPVALGNTEGHVCLPGSYGAGEALDVATVGLLRRQAKARAPYG